MKTFVTYWGKEQARLLAGSLVPPKLGPSPGFKKLQWLRPVYAGDTVTYSVTLVESRPLASRPGTMLHVIANEGVNQRGEAVLSFEGSVLEFD
ncbi:dehydratase [Neorhizobium sp. NCHU2750]|nr:dehydratase [Neorhizobium sp. NCHU2750]